MKIFHVYTSFLAADNGRVTASSTLTCLCPVAPEDTVVVRSSANYIRSVSPVLKLASAGLRGCVRSQFGGLGCSAQMSRVSLPVMTQGGQPGAGPLVPLLTKLKVKDNYSRPLVVTLVIHCLQHLQGACFKHCIFNLKIS